MNTRFEEFKDEIDELVKLLTSDTWEFHGVPNPTPEKILADYKNQLYTGEGKKTFWIILDGNIKAGMIRIYDLEDAVPLFDIRISSKYKGMGVGTSTIKWLVDFIFNNYPGIKRIEGTTRQDNFAMRSVFHKCGFVKEAHYRKAWADNHDSIGYGITKEDWQNGTTTPVDWNDYKY